MIRAGTIGPQASGDGSVAQTAKPSSHREDKGDLRLPLTNTYHECPSFGTGPTGREIRWGGVRATVGKSMPVVRLQEPGAWPTPLEKLHFECSPLSIGLQ